jgi:hypothetical protein
MTRVLAILFLLLATARAAQPAMAPTEGKRFMAVDIFIDPATRPLAAYQLEFTATGGEAKIVGIEGGNHAAFNQAPYYDPRAIQQERVVIAAFSTAKPGDLPSGRIRVATIHLQAGGSAPPELAAKLVTAATSKGRKISAVVLATERTQP